jgi:XTP/dITP diphosphohydrolase
VLATANAGKVREFNRLLGGAIDVRPLPQGFALPPETGDTFAANARIKAKAVFEALGRAQAVLADDSGLEVAALGGRPGIYSARFAGDAARDADNVAKLLCELLAEADRSARFVCALCLIVPDTRTGDLVDAPPRRGTDVRREAAPRIFEVEGITNGSITHAPRGTDGFGYDPIFQPDGWGLTLAEATPHDKDSVSHRGAAARALLARLEEQGAEQRG